MTAVRRLTMIFVVPIFLVLGGCPPPNPDVFIFNNYGADVAVEGRYGEVDWPAGTSIELESYHFTKEQSDTGSSAYIGLVLGEQRVRYRVDDVVFYGGRWVIGDTLTLQLEKDGCIYLAGEENAPSVAKLPEQPKGFPLVPEPSSAPMTPYPAHQNKRL